MFDIIERNAIPPAQLWIGKHEELLEKVVSFLQKVFCKNNGCSYCSLCRQITDQQFYGITWLLPERAYTLEHLEPVMAKITLTLEKDDCHFFVLQKADSLTTISANSLLKSIEEPPVGYYFILTAEHLEEILPTIRSRCIVSNFYSKKQYIKHQNLYVFFTYSIDRSPSLFLKELEMATVSELDVLTLLDQVLIYWVQEAKKMIETNNSIEYEKIVVNIEKIKTALSKPIMNGSGNIVLKDLFLQISYS